MFATPLEQRIRNLIEPSLAHMGYVIVRVRLEGKKEPVVQIMAERHDGSGITLDECATISHTVSALMDVEDPIMSAYRLEVSSPGMDRPLVSRQDFVTYQGQQIKIDMQVPVNGRKRFKGQLLGEAERMVTLAIEEGEVTLPLDDIRDAKLVITEEMLRQAQRQAKQRAKVMPAEEELDTARGSH